MASRLVGSLEHFYDCVEQFVETFACLCYGWHHRDTNHRAEVFVVEFRSCGIEFVVHVESNNYALTKVD